MSRALVATVSSTIWHCRLGHPRHEALSKLTSTSAISCHKITSDSIYYACQVGCHTRLPFANSTSRALKNFDLIHCDLWTSPISSVSGYKYYLSILDDCSHFLWTFPLRLKSETFTILAIFFSYVKTQFGYTIQSIQCDNGREFDNSYTHTFFLTHGVLLRMSSYWVEDLHTATYLLNRLPTKTLTYGTLYFALFGSHPSYDHLRVFGCVCYPNMSATSPHKLPPL
jgi:hypothetical protein